MKERRFLVGGEKFGKKIIASILIVIMAVLIVEIVGNYRVLLLPSEQMGIIDVSNDLIEIEGFEEQSGEYYLDDKTGFLRWEINGLYIDKFQYNFLCRDLLTTTITVGYLNGYGKEEVLEIEDANPKTLNCSVVNIKKNVQWIQMDATNDDAAMDLNEKVIISQPQIKNEISINKYRIFCTILFVIMILIGWFGRQLISIKIEYGFAVIALCMGLIILISLPINKVGWDEEVHFQYAYQMSLTPGAENISTEIEAQFGQSSYNWPYNQPASYEEKEALIEAQNQNYLNGDHAVLVESSLCGMYTPGLVLQAMVMKVVRGLGADFSTIYFSGRLAGLLMYVFLLFWAIRIIPVGKRILLFMALTPTSLFIATCYSYDIAVFGLIVLGIALILREWLTEKRKANWKCVGLAGVCLGLGIMPKAVYAPLVLLEWFIPVEKFKSKKQAYMLRIIFLAIFVALMLSFVLPQLLTPSEMADTRGGAVNPGEQLGNILQHPLTYLKIVLQNIVKTFPEYAFGEDSFRLMGHLQTGYFKYFIPVALVLLILTDHSPKEIQKLEIKHRIFIFLLVGLTIGLVWSALYLAFNLPGVSIIEGVQGRYYRPFLILLYLILGNQCIQINIKQTTYSKVVLCSGAVVAGVTALQIFGTFCI